MIFFADFPPFGFQIQRLLAECPGDGGEVTEVGRAVARMRAGDFDSWRDAWRWLADHVHERAESDVAAGHAVSARQGFFRAANYYRSSEFFLGPDAPEKLPTWERMVACFRRAGDLTEPPFEWIDFPYEDVSLPGYLAAPSNAGRRPTVVYLNGADGTKEESWYLAGRGFVDRGINFVAIDGPGQGEPLRKRRVYSRPDYEAVVGPVIDHLAERPDVDAARIGLVGISMGGYYAGRAAAYETRLRCAALHGACHNIRDDLYDHYPNIRPQLQWVSGTFDDAKAREFFADFDLGAHLGKVRCPVYICHGTEDFLVRPEAAQATFDALTVDDKSLRWWTPEETGSMHANVDNPTEAYPELLDWVVDRLAGSPASGS